MPQPTDNDPEPSVRPDGSGVASRGASDHAPGSEAAAGDNHSHSRGHSHDRGHSHEFGAADSSAEKVRRLTIAVVLNVGMVVAQVIAAFFAHSVGLLSDAAHNLTDVAALIVALVAVRLARRTPTSARTFGWHRGTVLAAQANAASSLVVAVWITYEAITRLMHPEPVRGFIVMWVALAALLANGVAAWVVHGAEHDLNMRAALLHLLSDAGASFGVAVSGAVIAWTGSWFWLDPAISILIAVLVAWQAVALLRQAHHILSEGAPRGLDADSVEQAIVEVDGVLGAHDVHVWSISSDLIAVSAHVVVGDGLDLADASEISARVRSHLLQRVGISHATLELEGESCVEVGPACALHGPPE